MSYRMTKHARKFIQSMTQQGKEKSLVFPEQRVSFERPAGILGALCLLAVVPLFYFYNIYFAAAALVLAVLSYCVRDFFFQDDHALMRIYGPVGRFRYLFESVLRDKYLQYFNETNTDGRPIPRIVRDYIYQKAHHVKPLSSFGTELDNMDPENVAACRVLHRNFPGKVGQTSYELRIGESRPNVRTFVVRNSINISGMSYGSINYRAAEALSCGSKGVAYVNTGEGGYGPHGVAGNDVVFQIGTGKFGVGRVGTRPDGSETRLLDDALLKSLVRENENIGMIQIKISQGAKPALGGHLPGGKVTPEIAAVRRIEPHKSVTSPPQHAEIIADTPKETLQKMMDFIEHIRSVAELPVGIKLCVGALDELDMLVEAMRATGKGPDAIQVDGFDGGTGAGDNIFVNYVGYGTSIETLAYLDAALKKAKIRDKVALSASGRIFTPIHAALAYAMGADTVETARGAMLALGCIQSLHCHTNNCPTGIATNNPWRMRGIDIPEKSTRIHGYLTGFHEDLLQVTKVTGHIDPRDITPNDLRVFDNNAHIQKHFTEDPLGVRIPAVGGGKRRRK